MKKKLTILALSTLAILLVSSYIIAGDRENIVATSTPRMAIDNEAVSSLLFDGSGDYVNIGSSTTINNTSSFTFSTLINPSAFSNTFFIKGRGGVSGYGLKIGSGGGLNITKNGVIDLTTTVKDFEIGEWSLATVVFNADNTIDVYVDSVLAHSYSNTSAIVSSETLNGYIGADANGAGVLSTFFSGKIKNTMIWNKILTQAEITNLYYNNIIPTENLSLNLDLNEATGTTAFDTSGNSNNGTITGSIWSTDVPSKARATTTTRQVVVDDKASLLFDGSNDYIELPKINAVGESDLTWGGTFLMTEKASDDLFSRPAGVSTRIEITAGGQFSSDIGLTTTSITGVSGGRYEIGKWYQVYSVLDSGTLNLYVNGLLVATDATGSGTVSQDVNQFWNIATLNGGAFSKIYCTEAKMYVGTALTATQISDLYYNNITPTTGLVMNLPLNEGAGATAYDTSGNSNNGTITGATWSSDTPSQKRKVVNGNLIENGDFEYAPPFVAVQTSDGWIDGTASGGGAGANINPIKWYLNLNGTSDVQFATSTTYSGDYSLRLSTRDTNTAFIEVHYNDTGHYSSGLVVEPSTSYTLTHWMKTDYVSGDSGDGALIAVPQGDGQGTGVTTSNSTKVKTTTGWTKYTTVFTTNSATREVNIEPRIYGHTGTGTLIMDAWFDDIVLKKTSDL